MKKLLIVFDFLQRKLVIGPMSQRINAPGIIVPAVAKIRLDVAESPRPVPSGMASLRSRNGIIAVKKTVSSFCMLQFNYIKGLIESINNWRRIEVDNRLKFVQ